MASWAAVIALSDFQYSGIDHKMHFTDRPGRYFWSNGYAWGMCTVAEDEVTLELLKGELVLKNLQVGDRQKKWKNFTMKEGDKQIIRLE